MERLDRDARGQHYAIDAPDEELVPASTADEILHTAPRQSRFRADGSQCRRSAPVETRVSAPHDAPRQRMCGSRRQTSRSEESMLQCTLRSMG
jgi:hypothetical protein